MFGYVIPDKGKLTEEQWGSYRATYCGLCRALKERYGFCSQFLLNYDFTFLALLLRREESEPCVDCRHCIAHPFRGRNACHRDFALDTAADCSVLLVYWKLQDQLVDESGLKKLGAKILLLFFHRAFQRARSNAPVLDRTIASLLHRLHQLEANRSPSLDQTADCFARIMAAMVPAEEEESRRRELEQLLYHLGRWIYLLDAWDDLDEDLSQGHYNPIALRFSLEKGSGTHACEEAKTHLDRTLRHSENLAIAAFYLGDFGWNSPVIENILCAGLSGVRGLVMTGKWKQIKKQKKQELKHL